MAIITLPGDHVGTAAYAIHGIGIRHYERGKDEPPSLLSHVAGISRGGALDTCWLSEAAIRWRSGPLIKYLGGKNVPMCIRRPIGLHAAERAALGRAWESWNGTWYGGIWIPLFMVDNILARYVFRRSNVVLARRIIPKRTRFPICSQGIALKDAEFPWFGPRPFLGKLPRVTDPDDMWDEWQARPDRWEQIFPPRGWPTPLATLDEVMAVERLA